MKIVMKFMVAIFAAIAIQSCSAIEKLPAPKPTSYYKKGIGDCVFEKEGKRINDRYVWNHGN